MDKTNSWRDRQAEREETGRRDRQEGRFPLKRRGRTGARARGDYAGGASVHVCVAHTSQDMLRTGSKQLQKSISPLTRKYNHTRLAAAAHTKDKKNKHYKHTYTHTDKPPMCNTQYTAVLLNVMCTHFP